MIISIIIPTYNPEPDKFALLLENLKIQTIEHELIIIDSGSDRTTMELAKQYADQLIHVEYRTFNHGMTRNLAATHAAGDFLLFLTQDVLPMNQQLLSDLLASFQQNPQVAIAYARQLPNTDANPIETFARRFNYPDSSCIKSKEDVNRLGIKTFFTSNSCCMYRTSVFNELHGFSQVNTSEDMEFATRALSAGYKIHYNAVAQVIHSHNYTLKSLYKRYFRIGRFFKEYKWILELAPAGSEGKKYLVSEKKYLLKHSCYKSLIRSFIENIIKFTAYKHGKLF